MGPQRHEPLEFSAGDTLWFYRFLPEFETTAGWTLSYDLFTIQGAFQTTFNASPWNDGFVVSVPNFALNFDTSVGYRLVGYVTNPNINGGVRHEVYNGDLKLTPNFAAGTPVQNLEPYPVKMVRMYQCLLEQLAKTYVNESDIQRVKMVREKQAAIRTELGYWEEKANNYFNHQKAKNGQADPTLIRPQFNFSF